MKPGDPVILTRPNERYERMPSSIHTYTGRMVDPLDLQPSDIDIDDIAHALANQCRFSAHVREFYSVAQHAVLCSRIVPPEYAWDALHHDDAEYVLQDMAKPLKNHPTLGQAYRGAEKRVERVIGEVLGVTFPVSDVVKQADVTMLVTEARDLLHGMSSWATYRDVKPADFRIVAWTPKMAKRRFLARHAELARQLATRQAA